MEHTPAWCNGVHRLCGLGNLFEINAGNQFAVSLLLGVEVAVVLDVRKLSQLGAVRSREDDVAVVLAVGLRLVVLELDVDVCQEELDERLDAGSIVVPSPSVHVSREGEGDGRGTLDGAVAQYVAGLEVVGAGHVVERSCCCC